MDRRSHSTLRRGTPHRRTVLLLSTALACAAGATAVAANEPLTGAAWAKGDRGAVIVSTNWGRQWPCAGFENAQLVSLAFTETAPPAGKRPEVLLLETPGLLRVDDRFLPNVFLVRPGTYVLSAYEIKVARSVRDVGRLAAGSEDFARTGLSPGRFRVGAGELVYIGSFGLDCAREPIPWRYYLPDAAAFDEAVDAFHRHFPFTRDTPVRYRLFESDLFGQPPEFPEGKAPRVEAINPSVQPTTP